MHKEKAMEQMISAQDSDLVWRIFSDAVADLGFDKMIYGGTRLPNGNRFGDIRDAVILYRGPQAYVDVYLGEELYLYSPTYDWAVKNSGFASWPEAMKQYSGPARPEHMRILQLNARFGMRAGFVGSLNDVVRGMHGTIGMSPSGMEQPEADELWSEVGHQVETLSNLLHLRVASLPMPCQRRPLTTRQRETLHWFAQGKTMQDIAAIMDLSAATVEKHLRMARDSLDATTTAHAVQKATSMNLLIA